MDESGKSLQGSGLENSGAIYYLKMYIIDVNHAVHMYMYMH